MKFLAGKEFLVVLKKSAAADHGNGFFLLDPC
jgi:hypothetical protein